jgi:hypothetical protein
MRLKASCLFGVVLIRSKRALKICSLRVAPGAYRMSEPTRTFFHLACSTTGQISLRSVYQFIVAFMPQRLEIVSHDTLACRIFPEPVNGVDMYGRRRWLAPGCTEPPMPDGTTLRPLGKREASERRRREAKRATHDENTKPQDNLTDTAYGQAFNLSECKHLRMHRKMLHGSDNTSVAKSASSSHLGRDCRIVGEVFSCTAIDSADSSFYCSDSVDL